MHITLAQLRALPGASEAEAAWRAAAAARGHGWLPGPDADAAACDATVAPVVTGHVDPAALDRLAEVFVAAPRSWRRPGGRRASARTKAAPTGRKTAPPRPRPGRPGLRVPVRRLHLPHPHAAIRETMARLRGSLLAMAADVLSGPGGLASWLRQSQLGRRPRRIGQPAARCAAAARRRGGRAGHPRPPAPRRDGPPPALRLPRLRPACQRLPDPPPDPPLGRRPDHPAQPHTPIIGLQVRDPSPHNGPDAACAVPGQRPNWLRRPGRVISTMTSHQHDPTGAHGALEAVQEALGTVTALP